MRHAHDVGEHVESLVEHHVVARALVAAAPQGREVGVLLVVSSVHAVVLFVALMVLRNVPWSALDFLRPPGTF